MKAIQTSESDVVLKKSTVKKAATVLVAIIVLIGAIIISQQLHFIKGPYTAAYIITNIFSILLIVISHIAVVLCVNSLVFSFIKRKVWIYRSISAAVSLIIGANHFYGFISSMNQPEFVTEHPLLSLVIAAAVSLVYAAVIFVLSLLVQYIYKRIKNKRASTS